MINGLWKGTGDFGTIEFKASGEVIIVDNMSATVTGRYQIEDGDLLKLELTASDILQGSIQPTAVMSIVARIVRIKSDELQIHFAEEDKVESFERIY